MKKQLKKAIAMASAVLMLGGTVGGLAACNPGSKGIPDYDYKQATRSIYTVTVPSMWNELDSMDNNNNQIMDYLTSAFYEFDYQFDEAKGGKFKADGSINADAIVEGAFSMEYSAATKLEDVTSQVWEERGYYDEFLVDHENDEEEEGVTYYNENDEECDFADAVYGIAPYKSGYAWKITLRDDLKWNDGTAIDASDFVYSMEQQLDPKFMWQRANSYYGAVSIQGAKNYVYQGQKNWYAASTPYELDDYSEELDDKLVFSLGSAEQNAGKGKAISYIRDWLNGQLGEGADAVSHEVIANVLASNFSAIGKTAEEIASLEGKTLKEIKADPTLKAIWDGIIGWWQTEPGEEMHFMITEYEWPEWDFKDVGLYSPSKYELVVCFTSEEQFLKEDGSLSYLAGYEMASLPLVKKDLYEKCKIAPDADSQSQLWTSTYNTSLETTASWGPYMLTQYTAGDSYTLEKNEYWYGYNLEQNKNQYNVPKITCKKVAESSTQWMMFLSGQIDSIGIDPDHAGDYRDSKYSYFTPGTYTFSLHFNSGLESLLKSGRNNGILAIEDFRKAISLATDRDAYAKALTTAYKGAYGFLNEMYYYDVENSGVYRDTVQGKKALLRAYGYVEEEDGTWSLPSNDRIKNYELDDAYDTLKGYDPVLAKEYLLKAYKELTDNAEKYGYDASKKIQIKFGTSADNDDTRKECNHIQTEIIDKLTAGTPLEGKIELVFDASFGNQWSEEFIAGNYELCTSAWGSAAFNPFYFIGAYLDPDNAYTVGYWDTEKEVMTFKMPGKEGEFAGAGQELTMTIMNWYRCLNNYEHSAADKYTYNWGSGSIKDEYRLEVLAALEEHILLHYYSIPTITQNSATLVSAKFSYISDEYNTFMGYGGLRYLIANYTDDEWTEYVAANNNDLSTEYKKTA